MKSFSSLTIFNRVSFLDKLLFTKHLSVMVKSGIPMPEGVRILKDQTSNPQFKKILTNVEKEISNGQTLEKALSTAPEVFDDLYINLISIGEGSGKLEENLAYLAQELQKTYEFDKKVKGAMLYPSLIVTVALIMGGGISIFVLPQLANLFSSLDAQLPITTRILIWISTLMQHYGLIVVPAIASSLFLLSQLVKTSKVKPLWNNFELRLPIFGSFIQNSEAASFCRNFGLMLKSGLPITTALKSIEQATDNAVFKAYVKSLRLAVDKGKPMEQELENGKYQFFPTIVSKMMGVGEKTGKLDETLLYLGDFFADEVDSTAKNLPTILEPALLAVIAAIVLFLALAIIGPIYDLTGNVQR